MEPFFQVHMAEIRAANPRKGRSEKWIQDEQNQTFREWIRKYLHTKLGVSQDVLKLSRDLSSIVTRYTSYLVNGNSFYTRDRDKKHPVQNSGVTLRHSRGFLHSPMPSSTNDACFRTFPVSLADHNPLSTIRSRGGSVNPNSSWKITKNNSSRFNADEEREQKATFLKRVHVVRTGGERIQVSFDSKGQPIGKEGDELQSWIGVLAREHIPIWIADFRSSDLEPRKE
ncbi:hypothetical protein TIFTF001_024152 [Ficus carica]|uniref:Uncharacterized protein n=1 Tax=Ficus carica TaxID=3494 RepID=A0AA88B0K0_FICCA|nr:hypothetical protein TIFTF001_024152 [Ficus carica]